MKSESLIRVGVVEDNAGFRKGLQAILDLTPGVECVLMCRTAEDALKEIVPSAAEVVLMDLNLPCISGIECTREFRRLAPRIHVVMLTIEENTDKVFAALRAGARGYLLKTSTPAEIVESIHLVANGGSPMSAAIARMVVESFHGTAQPMDAGPQLSAREQEVLNHLAQGMRAKEVAGQLGVSIFTVQTYIRRIYDKLHVRSPAEAVAKYLR